jgi:histidinol-phosphatase (PHP family)
MLALIRERGIPVVIGADAHRPGRVADRYEEALRLLGEMGFNTVSLFLDRRRREVPIAEALASLRPAAEPAPAAA